MSASWPRIVFPLLKFFTCAGGPGQFETRHKDGAEICRATFSHKKYIKSIRFHLINAINLFADPSNPSNKSILQRGIDSLIERNLSIKKFSSAKAQSIRLDERSVVSFALTRNCVDGKKRHRTSKFVDLVLKCPDMFSLHCSCSPGKPR